VPSLLISGLVNPSGPVGMKALGTRLGLTPPFSLNNILNQIESKTFHADITTPGIEALGGSVDLTLYSDGRYQAHVHMHDSGAISYDFKVVIVFNAGEGAPTGQGVLGLHTAGSVEGTDKAVRFWKKINRDFDVDLTPPNPDDPRFKNYPKLTPYPDPTIRQYWYAFRDGELTVSKAYSYGFVVGALESAVSSTLNELLPFLFGTAILNLSPIAAAIYCSTLIADFVRFFGGSVNFIADSGLVGLIAAGGAYIFLGPTVMFPVFLGSAFAMEAFGPKHRPLRPSEIEFAKTVFNDNTIPWDRIIVTNMVGLGGFPFTTPGMDGSIIIHIGIGNYFDDLTQGTFDPTLTGGSVPGYVFIHELTHAWQISNGFWLGSGFICREIGLRTNATIEGSLKNQYTYGPAGGDWGGNFNAEQQACIVADWFAGAWFYSKDHKVGEPRIPMDPNDSYFRYIRDNIWVGVTG
jgi:hypothetical protein